MNIFSKKQTDTPRRRSIQNVKNTSIIPRSFKRNRTFTGTTSSRLNSTGSNADLNSDRVHVHRLSMKRRKIGATLIIVLILAAPIWILISNFTAGVNVSVTNIGMIKTIDKQKYQNAIQNYLDNNPISRLTFFLDSSNLSAYVSSKLPEVAAITIGNMTSVGNMNFTVTMRTPVAEWHIGNKQYYVDSSGIPFDVNYFAQPSVRIVDKSGITYKIGTTAIASNRFLAFVGQVVTLTKTYGYTVTQASLPANTTRELDVKLKGVIYYIKLSIDRPAGEQVEDMITAMKYFTRHKQTPKYIDVRVSGKAFYK